MPGIEEFNADFFTNSSNAWLANKIKKNDCTYAYKCTYNANCINQVYKQTDLCVKHIQMLKTQPSQNLPRMTTRSMMAKFNNNNNLLYAV